VPSTETDINWTLIEHLAAKAHKHLNLTGCELTCPEGHDHSPGTNEVLGEARTVQHLLDLVGIPEGRGYSAHVDARTYLAIRRILDQAQRLERIAAWHSRESGPGGMVGDFCTECGNLWPCDTRRMAQGTYTDEDDGS